MRRRDTQDVNAEQHEIAVNQNLKAIEPKIAKHVADFVLHAKLRRIFYVLNVLFVDDCRCHISPSNSVCCGHSTQNCCSA